MAKTDLAAELRQARAAFDRLCVQGQQLDDEARKLEADIAKLRDADDAVLLAPDFPQRLAAAECAVTESGARRRAVQIVIERQRGVIEGIEGKIAATRHESFLAEVQEPERALKQALEGFLIAHAAYSEVIFAHGEIGQRHVLFPSDDPADLMRHWTERGMALGLVQAAGRLNAYRESMYQPGFRWRTS